MKTLKLLVVFAIVAMVLGSCKKDDSSSSTPAYTPIDYTINFVGNYNSAIWKDLTTGSYGTSVSVSDISILRGSAENNGDFRKIIIYASNVPYPARVNDDKNTFTVIASEFSNKNYIKEGTGFISGNIFELHILSNYTTNGNNDKYKITAKKN